MIKHISDLFEVFIEEEKRKLEKFDMPHMPTLGEAYEEITKYGIDQKFVIPKSLNLKMVSGFIKAGSIMLPQQIDGMLVHGEGEKYGLSGKEIYPIDQVLCVFEVKKTLNKADLIDAFKHLRNIRNCFSEHFEAKLLSESFQPDLSVAGRHFSQVSGRIAPKEYSQIHDLPVSEGMLFYTLVQETLAPATIIHGYGGYKTESGFRGAFLDFLSEEINTKGTGVGIKNIPSLITSNQFSIIKGNGMPFLALSNDRKWAALLSTRYNPARMILEVVWSKISNYFGLKMPWGEDLYKETVTPLLLAEPQEQNGRAGWAYNLLDFSEKNLQQRSEDTPWEPNIVDAGVISAFYALSELGGYLSCNNLAQVAKEHEVTPTILENSILKTMCFMKESGYIRPLDAKTMLITDDDKTGYLSSDEERFDRWRIKKGIKSYSVVCYFLG